MRIGVPRETCPGETRVAVTPETAKKLRAQGHEMVLEPGAGLASACPDAAYEAVGAVIGSLILGMLNNGLILMGFSVSEQMMARGVILILAVALSLREARS